MKTKQEEISRVFKMSGLEYAEYLNTEILPAIKVDENGSIVCPKLINLGGHEVKRLDKIFSCGMVIIEPEPIPFTYDTALEANLLGKTVIGKSPMYRASHIITDIYEYECTVGAEKFSYEQLLDNYTFVNGSVCGTV